ncbi:MAG: hypothetical protein AAF078_01860 [Planctomycetota bacterium]
MPATADTPRTTTDAIKDTQPPMRDGVASFAEQLRVSGADIVDAAVPEDALTFTGGPLQFADLAAEDRVEPGKSYPITLDALSGEVLNHWWWGRIVLDLEGMTLNKPRLALDYCHDAYELVGYADTFTTEGGKLVASGQLTPRREGDRAADVIESGRMGVPYEASIDWRGHKRMEYLEEDTTTEVNGRTVEGPLVVVREWTLRGIAVCPHGADPDTESRFSRARVARRGAGVTPSSTPRSSAQELAVADKPDTNDAQPTADAATETPKPADTEQLTDATPDAKPAEAEATPASKFIERFGEVQGSIYFAKGMTFAEALEAHVAHLEGQVKDRDEQLTKFKQTAADSRGGDPLTAAEDAETDAADPAADRFTSALGDNLGRVAGAIKLPT